MKLYEFEAKQIFKDAQVPVQEFLVVENPDQIQEVSEEVVVKIQTLAGKRGKAGGIKFAASVDEVKNIAQQLLGSTMLNENIKKVLIEKKLNIKEEYYTGIIFSQEERAPIFILSKEGGVDIEEVPKEKIFTHTINYTTGFTFDQAKALVQKAQINSDQLAKIMVRMYAAFTENDMQMCEINPMVLTQENSLIAADAVVVLDDSAKFRWKYDLPERVNTGREKTPIEKEANAIDAEDYRGVAGKTFIEFDGDIGILASGGGASITCVDALISYGGKPANYTEYSGNPSAEKVEKLTRVVLKKPGLNGLWVVGGTANFTRVDITFQGIANALKDIKPDFPIIIRRGGPFEKEGFEILKETAKEYGLDVHCYEDTTPMTISAKILVEKVNEYKNKKGLQ